MADLKGIGQLTLSIIKWYVNKSNTTPPHIIKRFYIKYYKYRYSINVLIETGTFLGEMVRKQRKCFKKIYSIEIDPILFRRAKDKFKRFENINIIYGDSSEQLIRVLEYLQEPAIFWLDGHYSGKGTSKGFKQTPIFEELSLILKHYIKNHVIIIDDARYFIGENDYPTVNGIKELVRSRNNDLIVKIKNDIIFISK